VHWLVFHWWLPPTSPRCWSCGSQEPASPILNRQRPPTRSLAARFPAIPIRPGLHQRTRGGQEPSGH